MDRENIMFVLFRSIRLFQDVTGEIAFLNGIPDHDMLDGLCSCRIAAMTGLDSHAQVVIIFLPSVVLNLEKDPVEQPCFVAIHQLWKDTVVLVDQSEAFTGSCFPVAFHPSVMHMFAPPFSFLEVRLAGLRHLLLTYVILRNATE